MQAIHISKRQSLMLVASAIMIFTVVTLLLAQQTERSFRPVRLLKPQPVITDFQIKPVSTTGNALNPSELVIGVTIDGKSRAYPINMLTGPSREILNDTLGGRAIAATW